MADMVVAYLGWNSSSQGWNGGTWGNNVALPGSTGSVGSVVVAATAVVPVTGLSATALVNSATILVWGGIVPDQNPEYSTITPSQTPVWTEIAA